MKTSTIVAVVVALIVVVGGGYWYWSTHSAAYSGRPSDAMGLNGSPDQGNLGQPASTTLQTPGGDGTDVSQNLILGLNTSATLGTYLSAYNGMTVYIYSKDTKNVSNCSGTCAANWPPYTVPTLAAINIPATITGTVGTITRADGTFQVTYNGLPLYFWKGDAKPEDTTGQGVGGFTVAKP